MVTCFLEHSVEVSLIGVATGGYIGIYTPKKSVTVLFTYGTLTHVLKLQWLVKTYTPPQKKKNQIPGYAIGVPVQKFVAHLLLSL